MARIWRIAILLCLLPSLAARGQENRPRVILVLCEGLTFENVHDSAFTSLSHMTETGAIGLMNCAVAGGRTSTAATLTLALGDQKAAEPSDELAFNDWESVPGEKGSAREVYIRRTGPLDPTVTLRQFDPKRSVKHLGILGLARRELDWNRLGAALASASPPVSAYVCGNADTDRPQRRAALLTTDSSGVGTGMLALFRYRHTAPYGLADDPEALVDFVLRFHADLTVVQLGDMARADAMRPTMTDADYHAARSNALLSLDQFIGFLMDAENEQDAQPDILLVSPRPPSDSAKNAADWGRLVPIVATGPDFPPGLLTSPTTRTSGLIANVDVAPTLLRLFHVRAPITMVGRPIRSDPTSDYGPDRVMAVGRLDTISALDVKAAIWIMIPLAGVGVALAAIALWTRARRGPRAGAQFAPVMIFYQSMASALLLAPLFAPATLLQYAVQIILWMAAMAVAAYWCARLLRIAPPVAATVICLALIAADTFLGQPLIKNAIFCAYAVSGVRYYGIGNEYLGILVGLSLAAGGAWLDDLGVPCPAGEADVTVRRFLIAVWAGILLLMGCPGLGTNAGSLAVTGAGFGVGAALLAGRRPTLKLAATCALAGLGLAFVFGLLDAAFAGSASSHIGRSLQASAGGRGVGYLAEIAARKAVMNAHLLISPWLLFAAAMIALTLAIAYRFVGRMLAELRERRPWTARGVPALEAALATAILFKDSGVVTAAFMIGSFTVVILYYALIFGADEEVLSFVRKHGKSGTIAGTASP